MTFRLVCNDGTEVRVPHDSQRKLSLFDKPEIVKSRCYKLQCKASHTLVNMFLDLVEGKSDITITEENFQELKYLSQELGFTGLDKELAAFVQPILTTRALMEKIYDVSRQYSAILKFLSIHQEFFLQFSSLDKRVRALEEQTERKAVETREYVDRSAAQVKEFIERKVEDIQRGCEGRSAEALQTAEQVRKECAKRSDLEKVACDVAELKENERKVDNKGDVLAQFMYGLCLEEGRGVRRNYEEAARYYKLVADQGNAEMQVKYGECLEYGRGVRQNYEEAARYYKLAADQGNADGEVKYGECLENGRGVGQNYEEAARYYRWAADRGDFWGKHHYDSVLKKLATIL